jgi:hypothetical protein
LLTNVHLGHLRLLALFVFEDSGNENNFQEYFLLLVLLFGIFRFIKFLHFPKIPRGGWRRCLAMPFKLPPQGRRTQPSEASHSAAAAGVCSFDASQQSTYVTST